MTKNYNMPPMPERGEAFPASKYDLVMQDLLLRQAGRTVFLAGNPIWEAPGYVGFGGWAETCTIVASPTRAILDPDRLNDFMFGLTTVPYTTVDRAFGRGRESGLEIPKLYFDEVLAQINRTIFSRVDQMLAFRTGLRLDAPEEEQKIETVNRRTWLYVYPDPDTAQIAHQVMTGELQADPMTFSQYHLYDEQVESIRRAQRTALFKRLLGR